MTLSAREAKIETSIDDRRRRRHRLLLEIEAKASESLSSKVTVYDISDTGLLVETTVPLGVGEMIEVNLPHAGLRVAEVVWASGQLVGCKFTKQLTTGAISAALLGGSFTAANTRELAFDADVLVVDTNEKNANLISDKLSLRSTMWAIIGLALSSWAIVGALTFWTLS